MSPKISIITPSYNQGIFIERTIKSVLDQQVPNLEYVVFDGGSTDETVDILRRYDGRIRWVSEKDNGQSHAVNKGILATSGEIIGWLNSDDIYYPHAIQTVCDFFDANPTVDVVYGGANHIDEHDNIIEPYPIEAWNLKRLSKFCFLSQPAVFFRRSAVEKYGLLNEQLHYSMDYEYWLRLGMKGATFQLIPALLAGSRLHANTKTLGSRVVAHCEILTMLKQTLGKVPTVWLSHYSHIVLESKGVTPLTKKLKFAVCLSGFALYSSAKWNKNISFGLMILICIWMRNGLKGLCRK